MLDLITCECLFERIRDDKSKLKEVQFFKTLIARLSQTAETMFKA